MVFFIKESKGRYASHLIFLAFLFAAFGFRFFFGLHCPATIIDDDEVQTYLIGLKSFTTHTWPYFGTDMQGGADNYAGQMAGALQGLLIAIPLRIWPNPLSPYLFLNLLTFTAFTLLAWYCHKRTPQLSPWFVFAWVYFAPWSTHFSTQVINQSYSIVGSILFFLGFMESIPALGLGLFRPRVANFLMGFGLCWVMQLHMSWVMLPPLAVFSLYSQWKSGTWKTALWFGTLGALPFVALLAPTYMAYGFTLGQNIRGYSSFFNRQNALEFFNVLARFLSLSSFEMPRFIGNHTHERVAYLLESPWLAGPGFFLWVAGIFQVVVMLVLGFLPRHPRADWDAVRRLTLTLFLLVYFFFLFSSQSPASYRFYEVFPVVMIYSFYCWEHLSAKPFWRFLGVVFLAAAVFFQVGYAIKTAEKGTSVFSRYRDRMEKAIVAGDYRLLAERRPHSLY